jgi:hypothetical protein
VGIGWSCSRMARAAAKRCTECRRWFRPAATAARSQQVCSAQCWSSRWRKLARRRRRRAPYQFRPEERLEVDAVVTLKLDRIFRKTTDALDTGEAWDKVGRCVPHCGDGWDGSGYVGGGREIVSRAACRLCRIRAQYRRRADDGRAHAHGQECQHAARRRGSLRVALRGPGRQPKWRASRRLLR